MTKRNLHLLIIDPQNDFCDLPTNYLPTDPLTNDLIFPALPIPGSHADMLRIADLIASGFKGISGITVTIDSHHIIDISHPIFWIDENEQAISPFTQITAADVRSGKYLPRDINALPRTLSYLDALEAEERYKLTIWPIHCEIGTWGQNVHANVRKAYNLWEDHTISVVNHVFKGINPWTEHYSAIQAEIPDDEDESTRLCIKLIDLFAKADRVYITGEAASHCVKATTEHIVANLDPKSLQKLVLVTDCMSAVTGFETQYKNFIQEMKAQGVQVAKSEDVLPELISNSKK
ncbi:MAG: cysteine hydrolase [Alphaproteobacteria bacterium]